MWINTISEPLEITKDNLETWILKNHPFQDTIWLYEVKNLAGEHARSGTAFLLTNTAWEQYKLRVCLDVYESQQTELITKNHQDNMPLYYGKTSIWWVNCFLFEWLPTAKDFNNFDSSIYKNEYGILEPQEMYKKAWKVMWSINSKLLNTIESDWESFKREIQKRIEFLKKNNILSEEEITILNSFFSSHFQNPHLKFWPDLHDSHRWNFMIDENNIHKAYAIDEWAISEDHLQWAWFGFYMYNKQANNEKVMNKLLKWYFKKNPTMIFDQSYVELIYISHILRKIRSYFVNGDDYISLKNKLISFLKLAKKNEWYDCYKEKFPWVYNFIKEYNYIKTK